MEALLRESAPLEHTLQLRPQLHTAAHLGAHISARLRARRGQGAHHGQDGLAVHRAAELLDRQGLRSVGAPHTHHIRALARRRSARLLVQTSRREANESKQTHIFSAFVWLIASAILLLFRFRNPQYRAYRSARARDPSPCA